MVHLLGVEQLEVAKVFATSGIDRFADRSSWSRLPTGEPILAHTPPTWLRGRVVNRMSAGDSTVMAVQVLQAQVPGPDITSEPLVYHNRTWHSLSPQSARN